MNTKKENQERLQEIVEEYLKDIFEFVGEVSLKDEEEQQDSSEDDVELDITKVDVFKPFKFKIKEREEDDSDDKLKFSITSSIEEDLDDDLISFTFASREEDEEMFEILTEEAFFNEVRRSLGLKELKSKKIIVNRKESIDGYVIVPAKFADGPYSMEEAIEVLSKEEHLYDLLRISDRKVLSGVEDLRGKLSYIEQIDEEDITDYINSEKIVFSEDLLDEEYFIIEVEGYIYEDDMMLLAQLCLSEMIDYVGLYDKSTMTTKTFTSEEFLEVPIKDLLDDNMLWYRG